MSGGIGESPSPTPSSDYEDNLTAAAAHNCGNAVMPTNKLGGNSSGIINNGGIGVVGGGVSAALGCGGTSNTNGGIVGAMLANGGNNANAMLNSTGVKTKRSSGVSTHHTINNGTTVAGICSTGVSSSNVTNKSLQISQKATVHYVSLLFFLFSFV